MVGYLPLDGGIDNYSLSRDLTGFHQIVTYTHWAADRFARRLAAMGNSTPVTVAGHGVDLTHFQMFTGGLNLAARKARASSCCGLDEPAFCNPERQSP